jgi:hypothetical protein
MDSQDLIALLHARLRGNSQLGLLFSQNDRTFVKSGLIPFSSPYSRLRDAGTYAFRANLLHSLKCESAMAGNIRKKEVGLDLVPLNDRIPYHDNAHTASC